MEENKIGNKIRELRLLMNLSQEELGRRVGVQRAAINKYEKGTVTNIPIHTIEKMAQIFDVSPTYIVGWETHPSNPLAVEVKVLQGVSSIFGGGAVDLLETYTELSPTGKRRLFQYAVELSKIYGRE